MKYTVPPAKQGHVLCREGVHRYLGMCGGGMCGRGQVWQLSVVCM